MVGESDSMPIICTPRLAESKVASPSNQTSQSAMLPKSRILGISANRESELVEQYHETESDQNSDFSFSSKKTCPKSSANLKGSLQKSSANLRASSQKSSRGILKNTRPKSFAQYRALSLKKEQKTSLKSLKSLKSRRSERFEDRKSEIPQNTTPEQTNRSRVVSFYHQKMVISFDPEESVMLTNTDRINEVRSRPSSGQKIDQSVPNSKFARNFWR